jgi:hypothetical protein
MSGQVSQQVPQIEQSSRSITIFMMSSSLLFGVNFRSSYHITFYQGHLISLALFQPAGIEGGAGIMHYFSEPL